MNVKPIKSEQDYDAALAEIEGLSAARPGTEDGDRFEVLVVLVQDYERAHHPVGPPDMAAAIEYELDKRGLTRRTTNTHQDKVAAGNTESARSVRPPRLAEATQRPRAHPQRT